MMIDFKSDLMIDVGNIWEQKASKKNMFLRSWRHLAQPDSAGIYLDLVFQEQGDWSNPPAETSE